MNLSFDKKNDVKINDVKGINITKKFIFSLLQETFYSKKEKDKCFSKLKNFIANDFKFSKR